MAKHVYYFGGGEADGTADFRDLLGGKGANLAEMSHLGIPVPAGFTISTEICAYFYDHDSRYPAELDEQIQQAMAQVEGVMDAGFGRAENPLLVSVRSGSRSSMPGMMETVLNIGLTDAKTIPGLIAQADGDERFVYDSLPPARITMYGGRRDGEGGGYRAQGGSRNSTTSPSKALLEKAKKARAGVDGRHRSRRLRISRSSGRGIQGSRSRSVAQARSFPGRCPRSSSGAAIGARSSASWNNVSAPSPTARSKDIPHEWGTAVNVQTMVFGNLGEDCGHGRRLQRAIPRNGAEASSTESTSSTPRARTSSPEFAHAFRPIEQALGKRPEPRCT